MRPLTNNRVSGKEVGRFFPSFFFFFLLLVVCADSERIGLVACGQESYITLTRIHNVARRLPVGAPVYPRVVSPTVPPRARCTPDGVCNAPRLDGGVTTVENDSITCCLRLYTARVAPLEQVFLSSRASLLIRPSHFLPCFCCSAASHNPIAHAIHTAETTGPPQFSTKSVSVCINPSRLLATIHATSRINAWSRKWLEGFVNSSGDRRRAFCVS